MKQVIQSYKTGKISLEEMPVPACKSGGVLVRNVNSLISIGTEKSMIDIAKKSLIGKAKTRPDLVRRCIEKAKKEGFLNVYKEAMNRLDEPVALGYSSAGIIESVGHGVVGFAKGDRVACVGAGFASHAELVWVPENLCLPLPDSVGFEQASFVMLGGIALQGIRAAGLTFGEKVLVVGLGLLGLLTVQMLESYGCEVIGVDINEKKVATAKKFGMDLGLVAGKDDIQAAVENFTGGHGADAVIITASATDNSPLAMAESAARKKGRIVLVGVADITLERKSFWDKELSFQVSKAAGPGSIEPVYEQAGYDYPLQYVRWTEKRNLEQVISLLGRGKVDVSPLISHRFEIDHALEAYEMILSGKTPCIGVLLSYGNVEVDAPATVAVRVPPASGSANTTPCLGLIGGGMFTRNILLPALSTVKDMRLKTVATTTGMSARHIAQKFGFENCTTAYKEMLDDSEITDVLVTTRHNSHGSMVCDTLRAGKSVYVEKPLCMTEKELVSVIDAYREAFPRYGAKLMVGFNRRYSGLANEVRESFSRRKSPLVMIYRVNAGYIPADHWTQDVSVGGGRIIGEVCHFIDFLQFISDALPETVCARSINGETGKYLKDDNVVITFTFGEGSVGTIIYTAGGSKAFSRERVEVFGDDSVAVIDDFKQAMIVKNGKTRTLKRMSQDMGYAKEMEAFVRSGAEEQDRLFEGYVATTLAAIRAVESLRSGETLKISISEIRGGLL